jgi:hypothetical protein
MEFDSIKVWKKNISVYNGNSPMEYGEMDRSGDTVFYAEGLVSFIRRKARSPAVGHEYFIGYNHRGNRNSWGDAMFLQVRPSKERDEGLQYVKGSEGNMFTCAVEGAAEKKH